MEAEAVTRQAILSGFLVAVELAGAERFELPPIPPERRPFPLLPGPWRRGLARLRAAAREVLWAHGAPGVFPMGEAVWVPRERLPLVWAAARALEPAVAAFRARLRAAYPDLRKAALRRAEALGRRRARRRPGWAGEAETAARLHRELAARVFPAEAELADLPALRVTALPVPEGWAEAARPEALRRWWAARLWAVAFELLPAAGTPLHPRRRARLWAILPEIPDGNGAGPARWRRRLEALLREGTGGEEMRTAVQEILAEIP